MAKKIEKTNAARLLDSASISYELIPYEVDEENLAADHVAGQLGEDIEQAKKKVDEINNLKQAIRFMIPQEK